MGKLKSDFKIIQSFWSKPFIKHKDFSEITEKMHRKSGGWLSEEIYYMSCALSCLKLKEFYNNVELVTDDFGKQLLIDELNLPYTSVRTDLEEINHISEELWAIGKLIAYKIQDEPFLHVDNDVFIWNAFPENILIESDFVVQHAEKEIEFGKKLCQDIYNNFEGFTPELLNYTLKGGLIEEVSSYNFGVFGGNNIEFIKFYVDFVFDFIEKNSKNLSKVMTGALSVYLEQGIFHQLSNQYNMKVGKLFDEVENFDFFYQFDKIPNMYYIHTIGGAKRNPIINEQIYLNLLNEYPEYHSKIKSLNKQIL